MLSPVVILEAQNDAVEHIERVCDWCLSQGLDSRIQAIRASIIHRQTVLILAWAGIRIRSGPGLSFPQIGSLGYHQTAIIIHQQSGWGNLDPGGWITLDPLYTKIL